MHRVHFVFCPTGPTSPTGPTKQLFFSRRPACAACHATAPLARQRKPAGRRRAPRDGRLFDWELWVSPHPPVHGLQYGHFPKTPKTPKTPEYHVRTSRGGPHTRPCHAVAPRREGGSAISSFIFHHWRRRRVRMRKGPARRFSASAPLRCFRYQPPPIFSMILTSGRNSAMTIDPTMPASATIINGSIRLVRALTELSTSSS